MSWVWIHRGIRRRRNALRRRRMRNDIRVRLITKQSPVPNYWRLIRLCLLIFFSISTSRPRTHPFLNASWIWTHFKVHSSQPLRSSRRVTFLQLPSSIVVTRNTQRMLRLASRASKEKLLTGRVSRCGGQLRGCVRKKYHFDVVLIILYYCFGCHKI